MDQQNKENTQTTPEKEKLGLPRVAFELSKIASNPKQGIAIIVVGVVLVVYVVYGMFAENVAETAKENPIELVQRPDIIIKPSKEIDTSDLAVPELPKAPTIQDPKTLASGVLLKNMSPKIKASASNEPPKLAQIKPPAQESKPSTPPPPPPVVATPVDQESNVVAEVSKDDANLPSKSASSSQALSPEEQQKKEAKYRSSMILISGQVAKTPEQVDQEASFKKRTTLLEYAIRKGKLIDAVLETAINTDFVGTVRGVISRDVYGEGGKIVLIPKGSRIFGTSTSGVDGVYARININWDTIDLPTGYTINLDGASIDNLGRKGTQGRLDQKIKEKLSYVVMSSALNVIFSDAVNKVIAPQSTGASAQQQQQQATNMINAVTAAYNSSADVNVQISSMCTAATNAITDPTHPIYKQIKTECDKAYTTSPANPENLQTALLGLGTNFSASAATSATPTAAQQAAQTGITNFGKVIDDIIKQQQQPPTVTIDQGTQIKIFVNKDYLFPKDAVLTTKVLH